MAFERGDIRIPNDPVLVSELVAYQAERLPSGLLRYGAPSGQHDDTVMALAMAWSAVSGQYYLVYPMSDAQIIVKEFPIPEHWPRAYGLDIRWNTVAAIWGALDPQSDVLYLYSEYMADLECAVHAAAIRSRGDWILGLIDATGNGRVQADGFQLINDYRKLGLHFKAVGNPVESGILNIRERMNSGRLKVFASLSKYLDERRLYRRDERGHIVNACDNLQDATRCLVTGISHMRTKAKPVVPSVRVYSGDRAWMV